MCRRECVKEKLQVQGTMEADRGQNAEDPLRGLKNGICASLHACVGRTRTIRKKTLLKMLQFLSKVTHLMV